MSLEGRALVRLGRASEGLAALEGARAGGWKEDPWDLGAMALAHHALGRPAEAERCLLQMVEQMERMEAEELLLPRTRALEQFLDEVEHTLRE
jgi:hypothetical protein